MWSCTRGSEAEPERTGQSSDRRRRLVAPHVLVSTRGKIWEGPTSASRPFLMLFLAHGCSPSMPGPPAACSTGPTCGSGFEGTRCPTPCPRNPRKRLRQLVGGPARCDEHRGPCPASAGRQVVTQSFVNRITRFLPALEGADLTVGEWQTVHGDFHWANLTRDPLQILDWEGWGAAPVGYDAASFSPTACRCPRSPHEFVRSLPRRFRGRAAGSLSWWSVPRSSRRASATICTRIYAPTPRSLLPSSPRTSRTSTSCPWWPARTRSPRARHGSTGRSHGEEPCPLGGGEGQVPGVGVLGVTDGRATGEFGDLHAALAGTAVAALSELKFCHVSLPATRVGPTPCGCTATRKGCT